MGAVFCRGTSIICRMFVGTYYSTFTGYITRLRGYYNYPTEFSWYYWDVRTRAPQPRSLAQVFWSMVLIMTAVIRALSLLLVVVQCEASSIPGYSDTP